MAVYGEITKALRAVATEERKKSNMWFFKTDRGAYGASDRFIGVAVPQSRKIARAFRHASLETLHKLLNSKIHEDRLCALHILVLQMKSAIKKQDKKRQKTLYTFYLRNKARINNWDLVDSSAPHILGQYLYDHPKERDILQRLVVARVMWYRRMAIVSQLFFIRHGVYTHVLPLAERLLDDHEDLMHKALGWMLRELWKKEPKMAETFLVKHYDALPRTTLRYAIERMPEQRRRAFLHKTF